MASEWPHPPPPDSDSNLARPLNKSGENPPWSGWDTAGIAFLMFVFPVVLAPFVVLAIQKLFYPHASFRDVAAHPGIALGLQLVWFTIVAIYLLSFTRDRFQQSLWTAIRWNWPKDRWGILVASGVGLLIVSKLLELFVPFPKESPFDQFFKSPASAYAFVFLAVAFGPFMEELFFRGILYPVLAQQLGISASIFLTALPFALLHYFEYKSWGPVLVIFVVGIVLTWVRAVLRSVGASFVVHAIYNGVPLIAAMILSHGFHRLDKLLP